MFSFNSQVSWQHFNFKCNQIHCKIAIPYLFPQRTLNKKNIETACQILWQRISISFTEIIFKVLISSIWVVSTNVTIMFKEHFFLKLVSKFLKCLSLLCIEEIKQPQLSSFYSLKEWNILPFPTTDTKVDGMFGPPPWSNFADNSVPRVRCDAYITPPRGSILGVVGKPSTMLLPRFP